MEVGISGQLSCFGSTKNSVKDNAKTKLYWDYNVFNTELFKTDLDYALRSYTVTEYSQFQKILVKNYI